MFLSISIHSHAKYPPCLDREPTNRRSFTTIPRIDCHRCRTKRESALKYVTGATRSPFDHFRFVQALTYSLIKLLYFLYFLSVSFKYTIGKYARINYKICNSIEQYIIILFIRYQFVKFRKLDDFMSY